MRILYLCGFGLFGLLASLMLLASPPSLAERGVGIEITMSDPTHFPSPVLVVIDERAPVLTSKSHDRDIDDETAASALGPIYLLSWQTYGQTFRRHHMLC